MRFLAPPNSAVIVVMSISPPVVLYGSRYYHDLLNVQNRILFALSLEILAYPSFFYMKIVSLLLEILGDLSEQKNQSRV